MTTTTGETPLLTREGEVYLAQLAERGDERARQELIEANQPIALAIACKFRGRGLELDDLIQEANLGLHKATQRFNWRLGFRFGTCAQWWIRQRLGRAVRNQKQLIRVSIHTQERYAKACDTAAKLSRQLKREATQAEVATAMGVTIEKLGELMRVGATAHNQSLEQRSDDDLPLSDRMADEQATDPLEAAERTESANRMAEMLSKLEPREECVLRMRYGIAADDELELQFGEDEPEQVTVTRQLDLFAGLDQPGHC